MSDLWNAQSKDLGWLEFRVAVPIMLKNGMDNSCLGEIMRHEPKQAIVAQLVSASASL